MGLRIKNSELDTLGKSKLNELEILIDHFLFNQKTSTHKLNRKEPNSLSITGHAFSIPSVHSNAAPRLKHLKMEVMGQLFRVYRSKKHMDFTSTRSYLHILAKQRNLS